MEQHSRHILYLFVELLYYNLLTTLCIGFPHSQVMGKISSAVDCSNAIRVSNAGMWVVNDMKR